VRRAALLTIVLALGAAAPSAARPACGKRVACKGKARVARVGLPAAWAKRATLPVAPGTPAAPDPPSRRPGAPAPPPPPPPPADDPRYLQVVARDSDPEDLALQLSRGTLLSGTVAVEFNNRFAEDPHDLRIRQGTTTYEFEEVPNGQAATQHLALAAGTWKLWCSIPGHEQLGMVAHVTVSDG
jgi:hypothetical protein